MKGSIFKSFRSKLVVSMIISILFVVIVNIAIYYGTRVLGLKLSNKNIAIENNMTTNGNGIKENENLNKPDATEKVVPGLDNKNNSDSNSFSVKKEKSPMSMRPKRIIYVAISSIISIIVLMISFFAITNRWILRFDKIKKSIDQMEKGDLYTSVKMKGNDEFADIANAVDHLRLTLLEADEKEHQLEKTKHTLITNVAHDLRTPLTSLRGYVELMAQVKDDDERVRYSEIVLSKTNQLQNLIEDLFTYTKYEQDNVPVKLVPLDFSMFLVQATEEFYPDIVETGLVCEKQIQENVVIDMDPPLMLRAVNNLMSNAIKYGKQGKKIEVQMEKIKEKAVVRIINYGHIIPKDALPHVFEQFYRVEESRSFNTGGSGLGLAIAKSIVELHHGEITATSDAQGTIFSFTIPIVKENENEENEFKSKQNENIDSRDGMVS